MKVSYRKMTSDPTWPRAMRGQAARLHLKRWTESIYRPARIMTGMFFVIYI